MNQVKGIFKNKCIKNIISIFFLIISLYCFIFPHRTGMVGNIFFYTIFSMFGTASYLLPIIITRYCLFAKQKASTCDLMFFISYTVFFEFIHYSNHLSKIHGGHIGYILYTLLNELFDVYLSSMIIILIIIYFTTLFINQFKTLIKNNQYNFPEIFQQKKKNCLNVITKENDYKLPQANLLKQQNTDTKKKTTKMI
jgi:hypothetical protein